MSRLQTTIIIILVFALSIVVRRRLFNQELTTNWESLSAHVLVTNQLWNETPSAIHHFNLLYTFPRPEDKFIDNMGVSGVADRYGNYYYISMPHMEILTSYLFFLLTGQSPSLPGLQVFALLVHFITCLLLYVLARKLTNGYRGSRLASLAALCVFLFAPEALFFYQNGVVGSILVVPYSVGLLLAVTVLASDHEPDGARRAAWIGLTLCVLLGCLTDWHAYFTAFSTVAVLLLLIRKKQIPFSTGLRIAVLCCLCVGLAAAAFVLQNSRIAGFDAFIETILGRARERLGAGSVGLGLNTIDYYRALAKYYAGYAPFLLVSGILIAISIRRGGKDTFRAVLRHAGVALAIAALAVVVDHLVLANHTAAHSFTTLNDLVPIGLLMTVAVTVFMETSVKRTRSSVIVFSLLAGCVITGTSLYYSVYFNRPHPFRTAAGTILAAAEPSDVMFVIGRVDIRPLIYYTKRNFLAVSNPREAASYLTCRQFHRGTLAYFRNDSTFERTELVLPAAGGCEATSPTHGM